MWATVCTARYNLFREESDEPNRICSSSRREEGETLMINEEHAILPQHALLSLGIDCIVPESACHP